MIIDMSKLVHIQVGLILGINDKMGAKVACENVDVHHNML